MGTHTNSLMKHTKSWERPTSALENGITMQKWGAVETAGNQFYAVMTEQLDFSQSELVQLSQICRTIDVIEELDADIERNGVMRANKPNPAVIERRQQAIALMRMINALNLPTEDADSEPKRYIRTGTRGPYRLA